MALYTRRRRALLRGFVALAATRPDGGRLSAVVWFEGEDAFGQALTTAADVLGASRSSVCEISAARGVADLVVRGVAVWDADRGVSWRPLVVQAGRVEPWPTLRECDRFRLTVYDYPSPPPQT